MRKIITVSKQFSVLCFTIFMLTGCKYRLFDSQSVSGQLISDTILICLCLMLLVVIPTIILSVWMPFRYRSNNEQATYKPEWEHSTKLELVLWGIPIAIIVVLATITYVTSVKLDPREQQVNTQTSVDDARKWKNLFTDSGDAEYAKKMQPVTIQVVALDWKWLFIYPEENIATINEIAIPINRPVEFLITSNTTMNSFFIPRLGPQVYAMAGMENRLNVTAVKEGIYRGLSANYSGYGFSKMKFKVHVVPGSEYNAWLKKVHASEKILNDDSLETLKVQSRGHPVEYYSSVTPLLFKDLIEIFTGAENGS